ncbi:MAG: hypothetical protein CVU52_03265 [Deltaproteobacteria bacterium HGW-Deltaproteobacteria-10]|nr:MAG: hypothetical protein CVU52_03265 [Deltaproteobacteria bacterium HGW-Deltaproteobacteria-10]
MRRMTENPLTEAKHMMIKTYLHNDKRSAITSGNKAISTHIIKKHCLAIFVFLTLALNFFLVNTASSSNHPIMPKTIKVVMDNNYPPYVFQDNKGNLQGILIDQWRLWEKKTGIAVEITGTDWDKALNRMQAGEFDVIDTLFFNETRAKIYDFSKPYVKIDVSIFFHKNISGISDVSSLEGFTVAVKSGDNAIDYLKKRGINRFQEYPSYEAIVQAAKEHKVTVTLIDVPPALYFLYKLGIQKQFLHSAPMYSGEFHRAVRKGNTVILQIVEEGFAGISASEYQAINKKWLGMAARADYVYLCYVFAALAIISLVALLMFAWNWMLRRMVRLRTAQLQEEIALNRQDAQILTEAETQIRSKHVELSAAYQQLAAYDNELREKYAALSKSEQFLTASEERYRNIFENAMEGFFQTSTDGRILNANPSLARLLGYDTPEDLMQGITNISTQLYSNPADRKHILEMLERDGHVENFETSGQCKRGCPIYASIAARKVCDAEGNTLYYEGFYQDITKRKLAEEALLAEHDQLAIILDSIPIPAFVIDCKGNIVLWNTFSELFTGKQTKEMIGTKLDLSFLFKGKVTPSLADIVLTMTDADILKKLSSKGIRASDIFPGAFECTDSVFLHGEERFMSLQAARISDREGKVIGAIQTAQDITEQRRSQTEHENLQRQLIQAQKIEAIGTLAGGIAHDFNNILSGIIGYTELCMNAVQDQPKAANYLEQVLKSTDRAKNLVQQILTVSRQAEQDKKPLALSSVINEVTSFLKATLPATIEIRQFITAKHDLIMADATNMHQIIMNLCTNAGHAMKETGGILEIVLEEVFIDKKNARHYPPLAHKHLLVLSVRDTGHGIPKDMLEQIFNPYFTTKATGDGTGLGLAIVHGIVKDHEGKIRVSSEIGKGTIFKVFLPLLEMQETDQRNMDETILERGREKILFIDDEQVIADVFKMAAEELGYRVHIETNPARGIEALRNNSESFDVVITDKTMPHMTGFDVAREIRMIRADIPIILCSGYHEHKDIDKITSLGISKYICKPIKIGAMSAAIREVLP